MTENQREFQKEINRLQREISKLQQTQGIKSHKPLPEQPKHITRRHIDELKSLKGRNFIEQPELPKHRPPKQEDVVKGKRIKTKYDDTIPTSRKVQPSPLKGRPSPLKGRTSPLKGTHLTAEERARRNAKRQATINAKKQREPIDGLDFAPNNATPEEGYDMIQTIINLISEAIYNCQDQNTIYRKAPHWNGYERMTYLVSLQVLVTSNANNPTYYATLQGREPEIATKLNNIALYHPDGVMEETESLDPYSSYSELYQLLTPDGELDLEQLKEVTDNYEEYIQSLLI